VLLLQPLVENAVRHGVAARREGGRVEVRGARVGDRLHLTVRDDGPGAATRREPPLGVGLSNTEQRLAHLFGPDYRLVLQPCAGGGTEVVVELPMGPRPGAPPVPS
jgi:two-component system LytT family sensor kinase